MRTLIQEIVGRIAPYFHYSLFFQGFESISFLFTQRWTLQKIIGITKGIQFKTIRLFFDKNELELSF